MPSYSYKDLIRWAESERGKCTSKEYLGLNVLHSWICSKGHSFDLKPAFVRQGAWCPKCSQIKKEEESLKRMREYADKHGGQCLSENYINSDTPLIWECEKGHRFEDSRSVITRRKNFCAQCADEQIRENNLNKVKAIAEEKGGKCLSESYDSRHSLMKFQCENGHIWETTWQSIYYDKSWCVHCIPNRKITIDLVKKEAIKKGWKCLSKKVNGKNDPLNWKCDKGHKVKMSFSSFYKGNGCSHCNKIDRQEGALMLMQQWAEERGGKCLSKKYIDNEQPLLWECKNGHRFTYSRDAIKQKDSENWCEACNKDLKRQEKLANLSDYAQNKGGKCLSKKYIDLDTPLTFKCKNGHTWETTPHNIFFSNTWCPKCKPNAKLNIDIMREMAAVHNGKCLSQSYVNVDTKLKWQCKNGHVWETKPSNIRSGNWCPECANISKRR